MFILPKFYYRKLRNVLTNRFLKFIIDTANKDPVGYDAFYKDYCLFFKEGIVTSQSPLEKVIKNSLSEIYKVYTHNLHNS